MNPKEVITMYKIEDPVYQGLITWRMGMLKEWYATFMKGNIHKMLEIGMGNFPFSTAIGRDTEQIEFTGLERNEQMLKRAELHTEEKFKSTELKSAMWNDKTVAEDFSNKKFDLVTSFEVFEHVPKSDHFIGNVNKVLNKGGYLILETPNTNVTPLFQKVFSHAPDGAADYEGNEHVNELGFRDLFLDLRQNGFEIMDFNCFYLPVTMWQDSALSKELQPKLYEYIHKAAGMFPFYSYVQLFLARKTE